MKYCGHCKELKPISEFYNDKHTKTGKASYCKICSKENVRTYWLKNKERTRTYNKKRWNTYGKYKRYNITKEELDDLINIQNNVCAICKQACNVKPVLSIDHDHITGTVRGLLCHNCNAGLGYFKDNRDLLYSAITYLEMPVHKL